LLDAETFFFHFIIQKYKDRTKIWSVILYGCEHWSLILREEHSLKVFEKRDFRRIFEFKRDEVAGLWKNYILRS
jgi:hypothetical protein